MTPLADLISKYKHPAQVITPEELIALNALRKKIVDQIDVCVHEGSGTKHREGALTIELPAFYDDPYGDVDTFVHASFTLRLTLYVFGPARGYSWSYASLGECIKRAALDVDEWIAKHNSCVVCGKPRTGATTCGDRLCVGEEYGDG